LLSPASTPCAPAPYEPITGLVGRLDEEIEALLEDFRLGPREAEEVLRDVLLLLVYRWERIESREIWLLATLKRLCLRRARRRLATPVL
jgi:hypothetical protein